MLVSYKKDGIEKGAALALDPSPQFYSENDEPEDQGKKGFFISRNILIPIEKSLSNFSLDYWSGLYCNSYFHFLLNH